MRGRAGQGTAFADRGDCRLVYRVVQGAAGTRKISPWDGPALGGIVIEMAENRSWSGQSILTGWNVVMLSATMMFVAAGIWFVAIFAVPVCGALNIAIGRFRTSRGRRETLMIASDHVRHRIWDRDGHFTEHVLPRPWLQLEIADIFSGAPRLFLRHRADFMQIGSCLSGGERQDLAVEIQTLLRS